MNEAELLNLLAKVKDGSLEPTKAAAKLRELPYQDLGFAKVDHHRHLRCGFPEVILAQGKTPAQVQAIFSNLVERGQGCLATRVDQAQALAVLEVFPNAEHDPLGRTLWQGNIPTPTKGNVLVVTAGTSDLPIAQEAETTARVMGCKTALIADAGVAGLHRILSQLPRLREADCIVCCAGMEGALPSVVGGLVDCPVIAVPTSIGYGASYQGLAALLGMLNSCAANVVVVNIDGGFCGGYVAALIARQSVPRTTSSS